MTSKNSPGVPALDYAPHDPSAKTFLGHPIGLYVLFFAELWERFNFYGMRALLIFYMTKTFLFKDDFASLSYGAYNGLLYATPLLGGMLADRLLGYRRAIILGGILMAIGEFGLSLAGFGVIPQGKPAFYSSLALLIIGNGFFKPNISTTVGTLYKPGDPRRDGAFTIFYMGINVGAALSPLICGWIGEKYGFQYGFGLAGIGMLLGLACFIMFKHILGHRGLPPRVEALRERSPIGLPNELTLYLVIVVAVPVIAYLVSMPHVVEAFAAPIVGGAFFLYVIWEALRSGPVERGGIFVILVLAFFSIAFWAFFEQTGSSLNLFTDRHVNRVVFGTEIPASVFQSVNAIFIVVLAPLFAWLWVRLNRAGLEPSSPMKFVLALFQMGIGFALLVLAARQVNGGAKASLILLILAYLFQTTGELCLSPVGLSMVTKMAPVKLAGMLMGMWFLCTAFGHVAAGAFASRSSNWGFEKLFGIIVICSFVSGFVLLVLSPLVKKWERAKLAAAMQAPPRGFEVIVEGTGQTRKQG